MNEKPKGSSAGIGAKDPDLMNPDEDDTERRPGRRPTLPVGVWANLASVKVKDAVRVGSESERIFFPAETYELQLLTNRTIKIKSRAKESNHCYVPLENVGCFQVERDAAFERRFEKTGGKSSEGDASAGGNPATNGG